MPETEFALVTISFKAYKAQHDLIKRAAEKAGSDTDADYMRETLIAAAARQLGEPMPIFPPIVRGRGGSLIAQAAARMGLSREQFEQRAPHIYAAQSLGLIQPPAVAAQPAKAKSGEHAIAQAQPQARANRR